MLKFTVERCVARVYASTVSISRVYLKGKATMNGESIKQKLNMGQRITGCWIEMFSPIAAEIMALSGYDVAVIDLEHGPGSYLEAISVMQVLTNHGCAPLVRTQSGDPAVIKRVLDIGPMGIMVPNIRSADEARGVVAACRYPPAGIRGRRRPAPASATRGRGGGRTCGRSTRRPARGDGTGRRTRPAV